MDTNSNAVHVMSFNIRTSTARDVRFSWSLRKHLVIERIKSFDPDLIGLQECQQGEQENFVKEQLSDYQLVGARRGANTRTGREMAPLMYRKSAFDLLDSGQFWLSTTPERKGSKLLGAVFPRTVTWAQLRPLQSPGQELFFFNTHFDYMPLIMASSAQILREQIKNITSAGATILTGDFNTPTGGKTHKILTESYDEFASSPETNVSPAAFRLTDTGAQKRSGTENLSGTIHKFGRISRPIIIDWILASNHFTILDSDVDTYDDNGLYPSDHFPVTATLAL